MDDKSYTNILKGSAKEGHISLEHLTHRDKNKIFTYIKHYIRSVAIAEDILQDTFLKVFQSFKTGKYIDNGKFMSWVKRIAHNLIIDHFRLVKQMNTISNDDYESDLFNSKKYSGRNVEDEMMRQETHVDIRKMIGLLPDEQKEVIIMKHYTGLSFKEIATMTDVSINTTIGRMRYALINLRKMMGVQETCLILN